MAGSTYSSNLKIELMTTGENSGTWGDITNTNLGTALEQAVIGYGNPDYVSDANLTISITNSNAAQAARALVLNVTSTFGGLTATRELVVPTIQKQYIVQNNTTGGQSITVKTSAGTGITVPNGRKAHLYVNGTDVIQMFDFVDINGGTIDGTAIGGSSAAAGAFTTLNASGATTLDGAVALGNASGDLITFPGTINSSLLFTDNSFDIGASGATRPRNLFLAGAATIGGNLSVGGTLTLTGGVNLNGNVTVGDSAADTLTINATITSNLIFTDNTYDIGASGATRPRNLFLAGNATIGGAQTLTGALTVDSTTDSTSTTTGSIQTDGGVGIAKALFVGSSVNGRDTNTWTLQSVAASGSLVAGGWLYGVNEGLNLSPNGAGLLKRLTISYFTGAAYSEALGIANVNTGPGTGTLSLMGGVASVNSSGVAVTGTTTSSGNITIGNAAAATNVALNLNGVVNKAQRIVFQNSGVEQWLIGAGAASETSAFEIYNSNGTMELSINKSTSVATFAGGTISVTGTGSRGVRLRGLGAGEVAIAGDGSTYAIGYNFYNTTSYTSSLGGMFAYTAGGSIQYISIGAAYNNAGIYVAASNKVGIATDQPSNNLQVNAAAGLPSSSDVAEAAILVKDSGSNRRIGIGTYSSGTWIQAAYPGVAGPAYPISINPNGGYVGIGESSPSSSLHVSFTSNSVDNILQIQQKGNNTASGIVLAANDNNGAGYNFIRSTTTGGTTHWQISGGVTTSTMALSTGGSECARYDSGGNYYVGATSGLGAATVNGLYVSTGSYVAGGQVTQLLGYWMSRANDNNGQGGVGIQYYRVPRGGGVQTGTEIRFYTGFSYTPSTTGHVGTFDQNGNFLVGFSQSLTNTYVGVNHVTGSTNGASFFVSAYNGAQIGDIAQSGTTAVVYNTTSDYRLKNNPQPLTGSGAFIDALQPKTWTWTTDGSKGAGFIAHEFAEVSPASVTGAKDAVDENGNPKYQGMQASTPEVIANLVAEIQSLRQRLAAANIA
jgi:hypothetical protein